MTRAPGFIQLAVICAVVCSIDVEQNQKIEYLELPTRTSSKLKSHLPKYLQYYPKPGVDMSSLYEYNSIFRKNSFLIAEKHGLEFEDEYVLKKSFSDQKLDEFHKFLDLKYLNLSGQNSEVLRLFKWNQNIETLILSDMNLNGIAELDLPEVNNLQELDLSLNNITSTSETTVDLSKLKTLNLMGNSLIDSKIFPNCKITQLVSLNLRNCNLKIIPTIVDSQPNLEHLDLSYNNIKNGLVDLVQKKSLKYINLSYNSINSIPKSLTSLDNLDLVINLSNCPLERNKSLRIFTQNTYRFGTSNVFYSKKAFFNAIIIRSFVVDKNKSDLVWNFSKVLNSCPNKSYDEKSTFYMIRYQIKDMFKSISLNKDEKKILKNKVENVLGFIYRMTTNPSIYKTISPCTAIREFDENLVKIEQQIEEIMSRILSLLYGFKEKKLVFSEFIDTVYLNMGSNLDMNHLYLELCKFYFKKYSVYNSISLEESYMLDQVMKFKLRCFKEALTFLKSRSYDYWLSKLSPVLGLSQEKLEIKQSNTRLTAAQIIDEFMKRFSVENFVKYQIYYLDKDHDALVNFKQLVKNTPDYAEIVLDDTKITKEQISTLIYRILKSNNLIMDKNLLLNNLSS